MKHTPRLCGHVQDLVGRIGPRVFLKIQQAGYRFGDAYNEEAHRVQLYKVQRPREYEKLKALVEDYCKKQDYLLTAEALYRDRDAHKKFPPPPYSAEASRHSWPDIPYTEEDILWENNTVGEADD